MYETKQFEALHAKLDKIINLLTPVVAMEVDPKPDKQTNKIVKKKTAVKKAASTRAE